MQKKSNSTINVILNKEKVQSVDWIKLLNLTIINKFLNLKKILNLICQKLSRSINSLKRLWDIYDTISFLCSLNV